VATLDDAEGAFLDPSLSETAEAELCRDILAAVDGGKPPGGLREAELPAMRRRGNAGMLADAVSMFPGPGRSEATEVEGGAITTVAGAALPLKRWGVKCRLFYYYIESSVICD
jgi:hypothetical protein